MEGQKTITIAYYIGLQNLSEILENRNEHLTIFHQFLSWSGNPGGRFILAFEQYLKQTIKFDRLTYILYGPAENLFPNGTLEKSGWKINASEIDIWGPAFRLSETLMPVMDFTYPISLLDYTFVTRKPKYRPQIFGIFQTFSLIV